MVQTIADSFWKSQIHPSLRCFTHLSCYFCCNIPSHWCHYLKRWSSSAATRMEGWASSSLLLRLWQRAIAPSPASFPFWVWRTKVLLHNRSSSPIPTYALGVDFAKLAKLAKKSAFLSWCAPPTGVSYSPPYHSISRISFPTLCSASWFRLLKGLKCSLLCMGCLILEYVASRWFISARFVWCELANDVHDWYHPCLPCQCGKIHVMFNFVLKRYLSPSRRFSHVLVELVGPLPSSGILISFYLYRQIIKMARSFNSDWNICIGVCLQNVSQTDITVWCSWSWVTEEPSSTPFAPY